ncbi:ecdysoneless [Hyphodiscus hymeniophilus]|uniref:Ecdysoneless n=1 Tax=Hyphodiscus hymeniophilus TaxID=353542 RepID=A0A9P6VG45_9HELO|nr:ecdysoneless [Hyphodiscus hymeniophilus]
MDGIKDEFKGFGDEPFEGFPKHLPDDCVEYSLFIIDARLKSQKEMLSRLEGVRKESLRLNGSLLKDYIWQRDGFSMEVKNETGLMYLHGLTNYGDSVEDEWLIVYMLKELSNIFPEAWIKVVDSDGEFLLIEAANALPRWLNPEIADNRVWIHQNKLRIVPLLAPTPSTTTEPVSRSLALDRALQIITRTPEVLINSPLIEAEAFYRLRNYPAQIAASMHHAPIIIPRKLAYILHERPASIAPAAEAFYLRDPIALRPLQSPSSDLVFAPKDLVTVSIRFTKVLYAQLKSQQQFRSPEIWKEVLAEAAKEAGSNELAQKKYDQLEMGIKVTSGFEMMITDPKNEANRVVRELKILLEDLTADGEDTLPTNQEISQWKDVTREDDEKWLDINFEDFEKELSGKGGEKKAPGIPGAFGPEPPSGLGDAKTQADLKKMVERFEAFLNDEDAGMDGAEMDEMDEDDDNDDDLEDDSEDEDKDVSFDENEFARMMREMMGMPSGESDLPTKEAPGTSKKQLGKNRIEELESDEEEGEDEAEEIRKVMQRIEAELNEGGALNLDPTPRKLAAVAEKDHSGKGKSSSVKDDSEEESDEEVNVDFNLAKNLLESFKSQAGMAGPGGNLLGMMGMQLPRDEGEAPADKMS